jgi:hypothetical protein
MEGLKDGTGNKAEKAKVGFLVTHGQAPDSDIWWMYFSCAGMARSRVGPSNKLCFSIHRPAVHIMFERQIALALWSMGSETTKMYSIQ